MTFRDLGLADDLLRALTEAGYSCPTPIQQQAIPPILAGRDVLASAQTGTGKTAGFTLPLLQLLATEPPPSRKRRPRAAIVTPTRELADQVRDSVRQYGKFVPLRSLAIYGGVSINPQIDKLRRGIDIVVATPGRLLDHVGQRTIDLSQVEFLVLDECDRMLDMGFIRDIRKILAVLPARRQTLLFSATFSPEIRKLAQSFLTSPVQIEVAPRNTAAERVEQLVHPVDRKRKRELLSYTIGFNNWQQVLVFARTKRGADVLAKQLTKDGLKSAAIHGNKTQAARNRALLGFKEEKFRVLVATDVASRGLDIDRLPYVVNYDLPQVPEDYIHRIGRTGRAGNTGKAISLVCPDEYPMLKRIERLMKHRIPVSVVPGYEPSDRPAPPAVTKTPKSKRSAPGSTPKTKRATPSQRRRSRRTGSSPKTRKSP